MVKQIIEKHFNGRISFVNNKNGVTFTISTKERKE